MYNSKRERKMMKRIVGSNNKEEVVKRKNTHTCSIFCLFIITIPFLIITKFSFINSIILSGVLFISCIYIFISPYFNSPLFKKEGWGGFEIHPVGRGPEKFCGPYGRANLPFIREGV